MPRLAVLADIHGNLPALEAVIEDIEKFNVDQVIVAGDMVNLMPFSEAVLERVFKLNWTIIRGNHENYVTIYNKPDCPPEWKNYEMLPELVRKLGDLWINRLSPLPDTLELHFTDAPSITVVHSLPPNDEYGVYPNNTDEEIIRKANGIKNSTIVCGHSHFLVDRHVDRWHILNPGSVGIPVDGIRKASYMILDAIKTVGKRQFAGLNLM
jgi:putative phosphoesterase